MGFNPEVFRWARERAGLEAEAASRALGIVAASLSAIEQGVKEPTRATLSKMAKVYHRPLLTFYLAEPPRIGDRGEDFRTVVADRSVEAEAGIDALVRDLRARQGLVRSVLEEDEDVRPLAFVGSARMDQGVAALSAIIERMLGLTRAQYRSQSDVESAFSLLRQRVEAAGVFVLLVGNLGSHHSAIPVEAFRGFAIADRIAPFIVINDGDTKAAWSFTLLHELAHLLLGSTGVSGGGVSDMKIERFCNDVAAEFLLPGSDVRSIQVSGLDLDAQMAVVTDHADRWRLSRRMVAYGLYKAGRMDLARWQALDTVIHTSWKADRRREKEQSKSSSGPSYYVVRRHRLGRAMLDFARHYTGAGVLSPSKAAKVLGVKPRSVLPLLAVAT